MRLTLAGRSLDAGLALAVILIAFGIVLRFTHLDRKPATHDEAFTALRVSGHAEAELVRDLSSNVRLVKIDELRSKYLLPNSEPHFVNLIQAIVKEEPQLAPFYYITLKCWAHLCGGTIGMLRAWSALLSLLALACMYWLCLELFQSRFTAVVALVILSVSPFFLSYSQDARHYSCWAAALMAASAALLRAMRVGSRPSWAIYAVTLAIALYTGLFSIMVAAGHVAYVLIMERARFTRTLVSFLAASAAAGVSFLPWAAVVATHWAQLRKVSGGAEEPGLSLSMLARGWIRQPGRLLYNLNTPLEPSSSERWLQYLATAGSVVLVLVALYSLYRRSDKRIWAFLLLLVGTTAGGLALQDLVVGGQASVGGTSNIPKYLTPCFLGIVAAVAALLGRPPDQATDRPWKVAATRAALVVFIATQIAASVAAWQATICPLQGAPDSKVALNLAAIAEINHARDSVVVTNASGWDVLYLSQLLNPEVHLWTKPSCWACDVTVDVARLRPDSRETFERFQSIYLFPNPSESLLQWAGEQTAFELKETRFGPKRDHKLVWLRRR